MRDWNLKNISKKWFYRIANPIRICYWFIFRPETKGAKCLIQYGNKFLLIRISYGHKCWTIPGGGVDRGETFKQAAIREAYEEAGVKVFDADFFYTYSQAIYYKQDTVEVYYAKVDSPYFKIDNGEIMEANWFERDELPSDRVPSVDKILNQYDQYRLSKNK
jgi:ADP-ribose pyrophosphatase YjhB (NUDIX family)